MRYVSAKYEEYKRKMAYRIYLSDALYYSAHGQMHVRRWVELIGILPVDNRSGDEIALDVIKKAGLGVE